jgi:hypothetical protein
MIDVTELAARLFVAMASGPMGISGNEDGCRRDARHALSAAWVFKEECERRAAADDKKAA